MDAATPSGRGLRRLQEWLGHVASIGCDGVLLTPIFVSSTHGYDVADPFRIDQRLGDDDDFAQFADACHARGLRLILDGVFNHVGRDFEPFRDVRAHGADSVYADWFRLDFERDDGDGFGYRTFEGHGDLVALNHHNDAVLEWATSVARNWLARGADGWRLDAAYAIPPPFVASLCAGIRARHAGAFVFGEVIHGDYARFVREAGVDSVTQYELHKAIWSSLNDANFFELAWALKRHRTYTATFAPVTFAGNHDVTRLASKLTDPTHIGHAVALMCTVPGMPCLYYGDELAWRGVKEDRAGGDDAIRPALPQDAEPKDDEQAAVLAVHRELIALRRARPWLRSADIEVVDLANRRITYRVTTDGHALFVALDVDGATLAEPDGWTQIASGRGWLVCERA